MEQTISAAELSKKAGVGLDYIYRLLWSGKLPAVRVDGRWQINEADAEQFLRDREARRGDNAKPE